MADDKKKRAAQAKRIPERVRRLKWEALKREPIGAAKTKEIMRRGRLKMEKGLLHEKELDPDLPKLLLSRRKPRKPLARPG